MSRDFINLIDKLEKKWDDEIVPAYDQMKLIFINNIRTNLLAQKALAALGAQYRTFYNHAQNSFATCKMDVAERPKALEFLKEIEESYNADIQELMGIYNRKAAHLRANFFQNEAIHLPMPTLEEQIHYWEIFPSDPENYPQYYTYDFK